MSTEGRSKARRWFRRLFFFLILLCCLPVVAWWSIRMIPFWKPRSMESLLAPFRLKAKAPLNMGHRGAAGLGLENTMPSFVAAEAAKVQAVEFDVMLTKDKQLVVFHDLKLEKRLAQRGLVRQMTLAELRKVNLAAYWQQRYPERAVPKAFRDAEPPTLRELFTFYKSRPKVFLNIELKSKSAKDQGLEVAVAAMIKEFGYAKRVMVSSFNPFSLYRFRQHAPEIFRGLIYAPKLAIYLRQLWFIDLAQPDALHPDHAMVDEAYMRWARRQGFAVNVWTVNHPIEIQRMFQLGVDGVISDFPNLVAQVRQANP